MELPNFLKELDGKQEASADSAPDAAHGGTGKGKKSRSTQQGFGAAADRAEAGRTEGEKGVGADPIAVATWAFRQAYPEGLLSGDAAAHVRAAHASIKPVAAAFKRHGSSIVRSEEAMRRALARSYQVAEALRDQPAVLNALLEERRIKATKPIRDNVFLATLRLVCPEAAPDTANRWAGALAYAAANNCSFETVPEFLRNTGIREAADSWAELRRAAKSPSRKTVAKADPMEKLRENSSDIELPDDLLDPSTSCGPFLVIGDRIQNRLVALATITDSRIVEAAIRHAARPKKNP